MGAHGRHYSVIFNKLHYILDIFVVGNNHISSQYIHCAEENVIVIDPSF